MKNKYKYLKKIYIQHNDCKTNTFFGKTNNNEKKNLNKIKIFIVFVV